MRVISFSAMYTEVEFFGIKVVLPLIFHEYPDVISRSELLPSLFTFIKNCTQILFYNSNKTQQNLKKQKDKGLEA